MRLLLDTHVFLWFLAGSTRLSPKVRDAIRAPTHDVFLSVASLWEIVIKYKLGKLPLPQPPEIYIPAQRERHQITSLPIDEGSVVRVAALPPLHRDPFDRILICQAIQHGLTLITKDAAVQAYPGIVFLSPDAT